MHMHVKYFIIIQTKGSPDGEMLIWTLTAWQEMEI